MDKTLTLLVPGLLSLPPEAVPGALPACAKFLARARMREATPRSLEAALFAHFGVAARDAADLPVAPVTYAFDHGAAPDAACWRIDPVYVRVDRSALVMMGQTGLNLDLQEARRIAADINTHFHEADWRIEALTPERWYLHTGGDLALRTHALAQVLGKSIFEHMPSGAGAAQWRGVMNEIQMLLHQHPVNLEREAQDAPLVNNLWLWGGGHGPQVPQQHWAQVWADDPVARGLAKLADTPHTDAPGGAQEWLRQAITPGDHLVVVPGGQCLDAQHWETFSAWMERAWFTPLNAALKEKRIAKLSLDCLNGRVYENTPDTLRRWWGRRRAMELFFTP